MLEALAATFKAGLQYKGVAVMQQHVESLMTNLENIVESPESKNAALDVLCTWLQSLKTPVAPVVPVETTTPAAS